MPISPASFPSYAFEPIGVVRSPFDERLEAPRQAAAARDAVGGAGVVARAVGVTVAPPDPARAGRARA